MADEDADWLGLSLLSGAHMTLVPRVMDSSRGRGGGCRRAGWRHHSGADVPKLLELGVARVFGPGTPLDDIVVFPAAGTRRAAD